MHRSPLQNIKCFVTSQHKLIKTQCVFTTSCTQGGADESGCIGHPCKTFSVLTLLNINSSKHNVFSPLHVPKESVDESDCIGTDCKALSVLTLLNINSSKHDKTFDLKLKVEGLGIVFIALRCTPSGSYVFSCFLELLELSYRFQTSRLNLRP